MWRRRFGTGHRRWSNSGDAPVVNKLNGSQAVGGCSGSSRLWRCRKRVVSGGPGGLTMVDARQLTDDGNGFRLRILLDIFLKYLESKLEENMVMCTCGRMAVVRTSWTSDNPGRRFYSCPVSGFDCGFLGWVDGPACTRCVDIIPGLLRNNNRVELNLKDSEAKVFKLKL